MFKFIVQKLHREGYRFVVIAAVITFILLLINNYLGLIGLVITIWVYYFFRDPERFPIKDENYLVSPADGKITQIIETEGPKELGLEDKKYTRISISDVSNLSINETLARTIITSVTTLLALFSIFILGGEILRGFSFAMILGVLIGTYSSIFVAAPVLKFLKVTYKTLEKKEEKIVP